MFTHNMVNRNQHSFRNNRDTNNPIRDVTDFFTPWCLLTWNY